MPRRVFNWIKNNEGAVIFSALIVAVSWGIGIGMSYVTTALDISGWWGVPVTFFTCWYSVKMLWRWHDREEQRVSERREQDR